VDGVEERKGLRHAGRLGETEHLNVSVTSELPYRPQARPHYIYCADLLLPSLYGSRAGSSARRYGHRWACVDVSEGGRNGQARVVSCVVVGDTVVLQQ
jgi:hypothetical protein